MTGRRPAGLCARLRRVNGNAAAQGDEGHRTFDHTGDLGLEVWAGTPERLYARAAEALTSLLVEAPAAPVELTLPLEVAGEDPGDLMVCWLNAVLLESELKRVAWTRARVESLTPTSLAAVLEGQRRDPARQVFLREVKAVSYHELEVSLEPGRCRCRLVVDI